MSRSIRHCLLLTYEMNTLRQMFPQTLPQGYKWVNSSSSSSLEDAVTPEKNGSSLQLFAKRLLRLPFKTIAILIAALLIFPSLLALTSLNVSRENGPQYQC